MVEVKGLAHAIKDKPESETTNNDLFGLVVKAGSKMVLEVLTRAFNNQPITEITNVLVDIYEKHDGACIEFMKGILANEASYVSEILLNCPDKQAREAIAKLLAKVVNRLFVIEKDYLYEMEVTEVEGSSSDKTEKIMHKTERNKSLAITFLNICINLIHTQCAKNWMKFDQFFQLLRDIAKGGEAQVEFMFSRNMIAVLLDFYLGQKSPLCIPNDKRYQMGNKYVNPTFDPLINTVAYLASHAETERYPNEKGIAPPTAIGSKVYKLSPDERKCLIDRDFVIKTLKEGYDSESLGTIICHWAFENERYSSKVIRVILKGLHEADYDELKPYLEVIKKLLKMNDNLKRERMEWALGYPTAICQTSYISASLPKYGIAFADSITEETFTYFTPVSVSNKLNVNFEGILLTLWHHRRRWETYTMTCVRSLLELMATDDDIGNYIADCQPPTYQYARYSDWLLPFINSYLADARR